uniref:LysR substrate-binding domain-containing protein n=2 Tax=Enterocloster clostridioformis TaxID=1531 RepID=UPI0026EB3654|nr:LysR substrate-binding domain-containing protein [Enterocloster clostridioformis]
MELTPGGEAFVPIAERWISLFRDTGKIKEQTLRQTLSVGGADLINTYTFVPLYREYLSHNPETQLAIRTYHSGELYHMLETRVIDIGYVYSQRRYPDILARILYQEQMYVICHRDSRYHDQITPGELSIKDEVYLRWSADYEMWHDQHWPSGKSLVFVGTGAQIPLYLDVPDRWAIAPASVYQALKNKEHIVRYTLTAPPPPLTCYEITHRYPKPSKETIIHTFREEVEDFVHRSDLIARFE